MSLLARPPEVLGITSPKKEVDFFRWISEEWSSVLRRRVASKRWAKQGVVFCDGRDVLKEGNGVLEMLTGMQPVWTTIRSYSSRASRRGKERKHFSENEDAMNYVREFFAGNAVGRNVAVLARTWEEEAGGEFPVRVDAYFRQGKPSEPYRFHATGFSASNMRGLKMEFPRNFLEGYLERAEVEVSDGKIGKGLRLLSV